MHWSKPPLFSWTPTFYCNFLSLVSSISKHWKKHCLIPVKMLHCTITAYSGFKWIYQSCCITPKYSSSTSSFCYCVKLKKYRNLRHYYSAVWHQCSTFIKKTKHQWPSLSHYATASTVSRETVCTKKHIKRTVKRAGHFSDELTD